MSFFSRSILPIIEIPNIVYDEKDEILVELSAPKTPKAESPKERVREYCSSCMSQDGEIICPRRHRCRSCKCYLTDDEWFAQK